MFLTIYHSDDHAKKTEMDRTCSTCGGEGRCMKVLVGKSEGKRPLERHRRRWGGGILKWTFDMGRA